MGRYHKPAMGKRVEEDYKPILAELPVIPGRENMVGFSYDTTQILRIVRQKEKLNNSTLKKEPLYVVCTKPNAEVCGRCCARSLCDSPMDS
jgi:hypothetical protein